MSIAAKCTCGHSLTGVCASSVKECRQLKKENTQLPKEVVEEINRGGQEMLAYKCDNKASYIVGATVYATAYAKRLNEANETIKILTYDNNRLKGEVEGLTSAVEELKAHPDALWVKASERLPAEPGLITWRWFDKEAAYSGYTEKGFIYDTGGASVDPLYYIEIEWLDESTNVYQENKEREKAVDFAMHINSAEQGSREDYESAYDHWNTSALREANNRYLDESAAGITQDAHEKEVMM